MRSHAGQPGYVGVMKQFPLCLVQRHPLNLCFQRQAILAMVVHGQEGRQGLGCTGKGYDTQQYH